MSHDVCVLLLVLLSDSWVDRIRSEATAICTSTKQELPDLPSDSESVLRETL